MGRLTGISRRFAPPGACAPRTLASSLYPRQRKGVSPFPTPVRFPSKHTAMKKLPAKARSFFMGRLTGIETVGQSIAFVGNSDELMVFIEKTLSHSSQSFPQDVIKRHLLETKWKPESHLGQRTVSNGPGDVCCN